MGSGRSSGRSRTRRGAWAARCGQHYRSNSSRYSGCLIARGGPWQRHRDHRPPDNEPGRVRQWNHLKKDLLKPEPIMIGPKKVVFRSKLEHAVDMIVELAAAFRDVPVLVVCDSWFGNNGLLRPLRNALGTRCQLLTRLRCNAAIFDTTPQVNESPNTCTRREHESGSLPFSWRRNPRSSWATTTSNSCRRNRPSYPGRPRCPITGSATWNDRSELKCAGVYPTMRSPDSAAPRARASAPPRITTRNSILRMAVHGTCILPG